MIISKICWGALTMTRKPTALSLPDDYVKTQSTVPTGDWLSRCRPASRPHATASAFSDWVFEQSAGSHLQEVELSPHKKHRLQLGKILHRDIELFLQTKWLQEFSDGHSPSEWTSEFVDDLESPKKIFTASQLLVNGKQLRCVPDLVLRNQSRNMIMIVERKTTFVPEPYIPVNGWPNVEAQLWCYSKIDDWQEADLIFMVGQLWHRVGSAIEMAHVHPSWRSDDQAHQTRCQEWFETYGGVAVS
jgi:hypothetical protein